MKAKQILLTSIDLLEKAKASNPLSLEEIQKEINIYQEAVKELEEIAKNLQTNNKLIKMLNQELIDIKRKSNDF